MAECSQSWPLVINPTVQMCDSVVDLSSGEISVVNASPSVMYELAAVHDLASRSTGLGGSWAGRIVETWEARIVKIKTMVWAVGGIADFGGLLEWVQ